MIHGLWKRRRTWKIIQSKRPSFKGREFALASFILRHFHTLLHLYYHHWPKARTTSLLCLLLLPGAHGRLESVTCRLGWVWPLTELSLLCPSLLTVQHVLLIYTRFQVSFVQKCPRPLGKSGPGERVDALFFGIEIKHYICLMKNNSFLTFISLYSI